MRALGLIVVLVSPLAYAHSGGLNACGCHFNRKTGECHCHRPRGCGCACEADSCGKRPATKPKKATKRRQDEPDVDQGIPADDPDRFVFGPIFAPQPKPKTQKETTPTVPPESERRRKAVSVSQLLRMMDRDLADAAIDLKGTLSKTESIDSTHVTLWDDDGGSNTAVRIVDGDPYNLQPGDRVLLRCLFAPDRPSEIMPRCRLLEPAPSTGAP